MRVVAILQARMNSSRLPGKVMRPLLGQPMVQHIIERVRRSEHIHDTVLAFPVSDLPAFGELNGACWFYPYHGDENDVVGRYLGAADAFTADLVVRIPCDNPCVDPAVIDEAITTYLSLPKIYVSTMYRPVRDRIYIDGVGGEVFSLSRLKWLDQYTQGMPQYREHPHLLFQDQHLIDGWEQYQRHANADETIRLDVNTMDDYLFIKSIYEHFQRNDFTAAEIVSYLDSQKVSAS